MGDQCLELRRQFLISRDEGDTLSRRFRLRLPTSIPSTSSMLSLHRVCAAHHVVEERLFQLNNLFRLNRTRGSIPILYRYPESHFPLFGVLNHILLYSVSWITFSFIRVS